MKDDETGAIALSSRFVFVAYLVLWLPLAVNGHSCPDGVQGSPFGDSWSSFYGQRRSRGCHGLGDICPASGSFCFPSTLLGFFSEGDGEQLPTLELSNGSGKTMRNATLRMLNGGHVSCSLMNSIYETVGRTNGNRSIRADGVDFCGGLLVPDIWSRTSNVPSKDLEDVSHGADGGLLGSSSLPEIELSPPLLDWGAKNLYSPSLAILKVVNKHKEHVLNIYDPFSTNSQFFAYDFQELLVAPGESASIPFIFLPRLLGFSSAQIVLQTTFGGFIIDAKGVGTSSPYHLQTLEGLNICVGERMSRKLSLYNPCPDELFVKEVTTSVSIYGSKQNHSTYVVCKSDTCHQSGIDLDSVLESTWFSLGDFGLFTFDIRPYEQWEIPPHSAKAVVELKFWSSLARKVSGAICLKLSTSKEGSDTTVIVPLDIEVQEMNDYTDLKGFVSLSFETLIPCQGRRSVFSISLRNDASNVLHVVKIVEETANRHKLFQIKYKEGLLLFPGTVTRIALLTYTSHDLQNTVTEVSHAGLNCMLAIMTNDSSNPEMSIPCHALVRNSCIYQPGHNSESQGAYSKLTSIEEKKKLKSTMASSVGNIVEISSSFKDADDLILLNWRSQATASKMSVLEDEELLFPVVLVGSHYSKWISVHNPSQKPVVMQLLLNSAVITDQCKFNDDYLEHTFLSKYSHIDSAEISVGFSIAESAITEAIVHPLESALFGPIIFRPSNRCMWKSSALIRNNLSGVEWLRLQAFGGFQSLALLEGSKPFLKLDFELSIPATFNASSSANTFIHDDSSSPCCNNVLSKELYAKNTGDLPLEVIKLKVSGTDCSSNGFVIHSCKGFTLAPGESAQLLISYQPDFSTSVVHRDLELAMANGILVIPMKASIPICMLNLCKKAAFRSGLWKLLLMMLFVSFLLLLFMFRIIPQPFSPAADDYFPKLKDSMASIGKAATSSRLAECTRYTRISTVDEKSDCSDVLHDNSKRHGTLSNRTMEITKNCHTLESPESNLTIRVVRDKGRRRKRRTTGAGLAAKFDVSSSQSGNSTPSSPLSSNTSTPKQILSQSPPPVDQPCVEEIEEHSSRYEQDIGISSELKKPESAKCCNNEWPSSDLCLSPLITNTSRKPSLLQSATFPGPGWRIPGAGDSSFLALMSPIAPHARAPGSKLCRDENTKGERNDVIGKHFTYDIWGNHFSDCTFSMPKGSISTLSDASEGGSQSFFSRDPQSLMMMPSAQPVSPGLELLPSFDVDRLDEMN
ncbi:hypothetical protein AXF42_Ash010811 [Apostasia shenzhenica]|uniref:Uncharacterized protein n=1 Tax=Apostasia shenzhenica TaxID=1088818 RepID=A0A2I0A0S7_9ASPA|nr:hypothetical protein AXF42_Ash010811 [Apostasia shenzhenica]